MEVEVLNRETVHSNRIKPPIVSIFERGQVRFGVEAIKVLGLSVGDKLEFLIHKEDRETIYFLKSPKGFILDEQKTRAGHVRLSVCSRPLVRKLMIHFGIKKSETFDITNETEDFYGSKCMVIKKSKIHVPIKWRKKEPYVFQQQK